MALLHLLQSPLARAAFWDLLRMPVDQNDNENVFNLRQSCVTAKELDFLLQQQTTNH